MTRHLTTGVGGTTRRTTAQQKGACTVVQAPLLAVSREQPPQCRWGHWTEPSYKRGSLGAARTANLEWGRYVVQRFNGATLGSLIGSANNHPLANMAVARGGTHISIPPGCRRWKRIPCLWTKLSCGESVRAAPATAVIERRPVHHRASATRDADPPKRNLPRMLTLWLLPRTTARTYAALTQDRGARAGWSTLDLPVAMRPSGHPQEQTFHTGDGRSTTRSEPQRGPR